MIKIIILFVLFSLILTQIFTIIKDLFISFKDKKYNNEYNSLASKFNSLLRECLEKEKITIFLTEEEIDLLPIYDKRIFAYKRNFYFYKKNGKLIAIKKNYIIEQYLIKEEKEHQREIIKIKEELTKDILEQLIEDLENDFKTNNILNQDLLVKEIRKPTIMISESSKESLINLEKEMFKTMSEDIEDQFKNIEQMHLQIKNIIKEID